MATEAYLSDGPSFIFHLLNQQQGTKTKRRLAKFNLVYDQSKVGGYFWRNPLTGYNYAYRLRIDNTSSQEWINADSGLKSMAIFGAAAMVLVPTPRFGNQRGGNGDRGGCL